MAHKKFDTLKIYLLPKNRTGCFTILQFIVILDFMIVSPIGYIITKNLHIITKQFGLAVSSYIFSAATF
jgi:predicted MFS family arabinose efflux permease